MTEWKLRRRAVLAGALAMPMVARAQAAPVIVGTWGGDYGRLLHDHVEAPILQPAGTETTQDVGDEYARAAKLQATRRLPRGSIDVDCTSALVANQLTSTGVLEELDETKIPNLRYVRPELRTPTFAPHIFSPQVLTYVPERVSQPPQSFADLLNPRFKGKIGFSDGNFNYVMMGAALCDTGNASDMAAAKPFMVQMNDNGLRLYPAVDVCAPAFKSGELDAGPLWLARVIMWQNAGIPVQATFPKEGAILYVSGMVVPKNAPNKEGAFKYLNAMLDPSAQRGFAQNMGYLPVVTNAPLSGKVAEQLALPTPEPKLVVPDYAKMAVAQPEIADWWKKNIQHG